jgi:hypothetical protein
MMTIDTSRQAKIQGTFAQSPLLILQNSHYTDPRDLNNIELIELFSKYLRPISKHYFILPQGDAAPPSSR